jgi:hypothetical protein
MSVTDPVETPDTISKFIHISGIMLVAFSIVVVAARFVQFFLFKDPSLEELVQREAFIPLLGIPSVLSAIFFLVGLTGIYLKHIYRIGVFGNLIFITAFIGIQLSAGAIWSYAFATPAIAPVAPDLLTNPSSGIVRATLISFLLGQLGWLMVGTWTFWVGLLPRWSSLTLILSIAAGIAIAPFADTQILRFLFNVLLGIGPGVIGMVMWRGQEK